MMISSHSSACALSMIASAEACFAQVGDGEGYRALGQLLFVTGGGVLLQFLLGVGLGLVVHGEGAVDGQQHVQAVLAGAAVASCKV